MRSWFIVLALAVASPLTADPLREDGPKVIATGGLDQQRADDATGPCASARIREPVHGYLRDTLASIEAAFDLGADAVQVDVRITGDGVPVLFPEDSVDCRTQGKGRVDALTLKELEALDVGYGLTTGVEHPLRCNEKTPDYARCRSHQRIPTLARTLELFGKKSLVLSLPESVTDATPVAQVLEKAAEAGRIRWEGLLLTTPRRSVWEAMRQRLPKLSSVVLGDETLTRCLADYVRGGMNLGDACKGGLFVMPFASFRNLGIMAVTLARDVHAAQGLLHVAEVDDRVDFDYVSRFPIDAVWTSRLDELSATGHHPTP